MSVLALTACTPACTPPEAKNPESAAASDRSGGSPDAEGDDGGDDGKKKEPLPKGEMIMDAPGVDLSKLAESQRATFFQIINTEPSACDKPHSLAKSLRDDPDCRDSQIAAQFAADRIKAGATPSVVKEELQFVSDSLKPRDIDIKGRPVYGAARAPVTVVVFADFECGHCQREFPVLRKAIDKFRGRAKLVFKHFPLQGHKRARPAAIATEAAAEQGKFWEMAQIVFANQTALSDEEIDQYAKQIGLDMDRFHAALKKPEHGKSVDKDHADGEELEIGGTPAVFVNGRNFHPLLFGGTITGWIDDALKR